MVILSLGSKGLPSLLHVTSGTGLPRKGAEKVRGESSSAVVSRSPLGNTGASSGASLDLAENRAHLYIKVNSMWLLLQFHSMNL